MPEMALAGKRILVTRPTPQARELTDAIEKHGGIAISFPVIEIQPRPTADITADVAALRQPDIVIFISRNAAQFGSSYASDARIAAVGPATAAALQSAGHAVDIRPAAGFDSEHLLAEPELIDVAQKVIRIVRGNDGRELLADTLRARGAEVEYLSVYTRRLPRHSDSDLSDLESNWRNHGMDAVTLMSAESVHNLAALLPKWCRQQLGRSLLVAPTARVLKVATDTFPDSSAALAEGPQASNMIDAIVKHVQTAPGTIE